MRTTFFISLLLGLASFAFGTTVDFASASSSGDESSTSVNLTVSLSGTDASTIFVEYTVTGGTATGSGTDYTLANGTLTIAAGLTSKNITMTVVDDALDENNETVIVTLDNIAGGSTGGAATLNGDLSHTYTINDNDATPSIQFTSSSSTGSESVSPANMELTLSAASGLTVTVSYTVGAGTATGGGTDFSLANGTATISAGQTTTNISATIIDDVLDENNETIIVSISGPSNATLGTNTSFTYTIIDDDATPNIQFTSTSALGSEAVTPVIIQLTLSAISGRNASVNYSLSGTASGSGTDYTLASGTATVTAGNTTVDLSATINNDILDENNETIIVTISDPTNSTLGTNTTHTYTITDNDPTPTVQFTSTTAQGAESITSVTMQLQLSAASGLDVSVNYAISGTATGSGTDYTMAAGSATITAGGTTTDLSATIIDDALDENDETLIVTISNPSNATLGGNTTHTYTLQDNDVTPTIQFTSTSSSGSEGTTPANIEVTLSAVSGLDATVNYAVSGTATGNGTDYTLANGTATISAGGTTTNISPTITDDDLDEAGETIILTLSNPNNASLGTNTTHTFTINDNDDPPTIQFSATSSNGDEGATPATLTLSLSAASSQTVTVDYAISGTATGGGTDYTLAAGTATITAGQTTTTVSATINDDALDENDETIIVTISNPSNATLGTNNIHTYTITDNDPQTSIQFSSTTSTGTEGTASVNFELAIAATAGRDITVDYAVSGTATGTGTDYTLADGTATITAGSMTTNVTATVVDDGLDENDETIILTISNPSNATLGTNTTHTYTITDNDNPPTVQFTSTTSNGGEATTPANLEVSLSTASGLDVTVDYTASGGTATGSGTDYTLADETLTISAGSTTGNISPTINDDALDEIDETIIVTISNPTNSLFGTNTTHTYTITDDDDPPTVAFSTTSSSANENSTPATFTISLSSASGLDVTVDYALSGTASGSNIDYSLPAGTATISAGGTGTTLNATITDDEVVEDDETIIVTLSNPINSSLGANTTHTYTITNDDTGPAAFTLGAITTTGGTIVAGYWNATNTGLDVVVPVENNSDLVGGTIQLQAKKGVLSFENVGNSYTIAAGDLGSNKTMSLTAIQFEGVTGFGEDAEMTLTAVITDQNTNSTTGTASSTTITVDQLAPTQLTIGTVSATGGNATAGYWNSTNTDVEVVVPLTSSDASLANGTVQLQAEADGIFEDLGAAFTISGAELTAGTKTVEIDSGGTASTDLEELTGFGDGDVLEFKAVVTDIAGNSTTFLVSNSTLTVDQTVSTITDVNSSTTDGYYKLGDQISIQINCTESVTVTGTPKLTLETGTTDAVVDYSSGSPGTSLTFTYSVGTGEESSDLNYGTTGDLALNGGSIRDAAGNDLDLTLPSLAGPNSLGDNKNIIIDTSLPTYFISYSDSLVKAGDIDTITAVFSEPVAALPSISIIYAGSGPNITDASMTMVLDSVWFFIITVPTGSDNNGVSNITITAQDFAGNVATAQSGTNVLRIDNTVPLLTITDPDTGDFINHTQVGYTISENSFNLDSARITWQPIFGPGSEIVSELVGTELQIGTHSTATLTNDPVLEDGTMYRLTFTGQDSAGNIGTTIVDSVTYDTTGPIVDSLTYSKNPAIPGDIVQISAYFNEIIPNPPTVTIEWPNIGPEPLILDSTVNGAMLQWWGSIVVQNTSGIAPITPVAQDRAGNPIDSLAGLITLFDSTWVIDNSSPSCSLFYSNIDQPLLTNLGKGGDEILITAKFSEKVKGTVLAPTLTIQFPDTSNHSIENESFTASLNTDSTWTYTILSLPSDSSSTGKMTMTLGAYDLAGNVVTTLVGESDFNIDNIPPTQFQTGSVIPKGTFAKLGWFNGTTDSVAFTSSIDSNDPTLADGKMQVRVVIEGTLDSVNVGAPSIITNIAEPKTVFIHKNTIRNAILDPDDFDQGDRLITWVELFDLAGNSTIGAISTDTLVIDTIPPVKGNYVGGIAFDADTLISSDSVSAIWSGFTDDSDTIGDDSGLNFYEWAVGRFGSPDLDSILAWTRVNLDTSASADLPLRHLEFYEVYIRATDNAGNFSDILEMSNGFLRLNSAPILASIDSQFVDEDVRFTYQVVSTDKDTATILGDTLHYSLITIVPDTQFSSNITLDEFTGILDWNTPVQAEVGNYFLSLVVNDEWGFSDTTSFVLTVNSVNDTPVVSQIGNMEFDEDDTTAHTLNLTQFVTDVDNNDTTEIFWSYLVTPDTNIYPTYPLLGFGPGMTEELRSAVRNFIFGSKALNKVRRESIDISKEMKSSIYSLNVNPGASTLNVSIDTSAGISIATFVADSNYYVVERDVIFYATDLSGAVDSSIMAVTIIPINDPPVLEAIGDTLKIAENDTLVLTLHAIDIDNSTIVFTVSPDSAQVFVTIQDSIATLIPEQFWVNSSRVVVVVDDGELTDTTMFILDVLRVIRPHINLFIGQNPAFTRYYEIMITDTAEKTIGLSLIIKQPEEVPVPLDTVDDYTWVAHYSFDSTGSFQFEVFADAVVGDTTLRDTAVLALARVGRGWSASSADGRFHVAGESGTVLFDQPFMIVDSLLFPPEHQDGGLYRMGHPMLTFKKPVLISLSPDTTGNGENQAIYQKGKEGIWKEIPTIFENDQLMAWTSQLGYFKIGPKVLIIPEVTALGNNYPNPFNSNTKIVFDVGFFGGPEQKVSVIIYNLLGQEVRMLTNEKLMIGHYEMEWNGRDNVENTVSSGVYIVRMMTNRGISQTKKMMLLR
ncbi:MAG: T9SS type A sorting domain-containing protein [Candidatus Marinimicrobia bacterium]|nr:T9SS type A sorting domain-containing protein [Candidatus Neomarinimicrobiota bacterium]